MTKNLVRRIGLTEDEWGQYLDGVQLEKARQKLTTVKTDEQWAAKHHVDDMSIVKTFEGETLKYLMPLSYQERFDYLKRQQLRLELVQNVTL